MAGQQVNIQVLVDTAQSAKTLGEVKQSIKDIKSALDEVEIGSKSFDELAEQLRKNQTAVRSLRNELQGLKGFETFGKTIAGSFGVATASLSLFTGENEKLNESIKKTEDALTLVVSFNTLIRAIREATKANAALNASFLTNPYVLLGAVIVGVAAAFISASDGSEEFGKRLRATESAVDELTQKAKDFEKELDQVDKDREGGFLLWMEKIAKLLGDNSAGLADNKKKADDLALSFQPLLKQIESLQAANKEAAELSADSLQQQNTATANQERLNEQALKPLQDKLDLLKNTGASEAEINAANDEIVEKQIAQQKSLLNQYGLTAKERVDANETIKTSEGALLNFDKQKKDLDQQLIDSKSNSDKYGIELQLKQIDADKEELQNTIKDNQQKIDLTDKYTKSIQQLNQAKNNGDTKTGNDTELSRIDDLTTAYQDAITKQETNIRVLELEGATERTINEQKKKDNDDNVKAIQQEINEINKSALSINQKKEKTDELNKTLDDLNNKQLIINATDVKIIRDEEDEHIRKINEEITQLTDTLKAEIEIEKERGASATRINADEVKNIDILIAKRQDEINSLNAIGVLTEKQAEEVQKLNGEIQKLQNQKNVVLADSTKAFLGDAGKDLQATQKIASDFTGVLTKAVNQASEQRISQAKTEHDTQVALYQSQLNNGLITQAAFNQKKKALDDKYNKTVSDEKKKEFVVQKEASIIEATIKTAIAVIGALANPGGILGTIMAVAAGVTGAAEIALIASQPTPAFAKGGLFASGGFVTGPGSESSDSINARLSNGESVINAKSTAAFAPVLSAINQLGGGVSFAGKPLQNAPQGVQPNTTAPIQQTEPLKVYVTEADITRVQTKINAINTRVTYT